MWENGLTSSDVQIAGSFSSSNFGGAARAMEAGLVVGLTLKAALLFLVSACHRNL